MHLSSACWGEPSTRSKQVSGTINKALTEPECCTRNWMILQTLNSERVGGWNNGEQKGSMKKGDKLGTAN